MRLTEIMTTHVRVVDPRDDAEVVYQLMRKQKIRYLVVQAGDEVVGVLAERDLGSTGAMFRRGRWVGELMVPTVTASPKMTLRQAAGLLRARTIGCLPIVENARLIGMVTLTDLLELLGRGNPFPGHVAGWKPGHSSKPKPIRRGALRLER